MTAPPGALTISIVTPSFNQVAFLEEAMRSVLGQDDPALEYVVIDGGSTDGSVDVIRRHAHRLSHWVSERDAGQYAAINEGFRRTSGEVMAWLNSDDKHLPWTLSVVREIFATFPRIEWLTTLYPMRWDERGRAVACGRFDGFSRRGFFRGENLAGAGWASPGCIQQESTFWRRSLWERCGARLDTSMSLAADFDLWARFWKEADLYGVGTPLGGFRVHGAQKTATQYEAYVAQARAVLARHGGEPWGRLESLARLGVRRALPRRARAVARRLGLVPAERVCLHRAGEGWRLEAI